MTPEITVIILAGGQGSRMGGNDKGLVSWQGKALVEHVIDRISLQASPLVISCNRNTDYYARLTTNICSDQLPGFQGPLAGIQAALTIADTPLSLVCACDTPKLPKDLLARLLQTLVSGPAELCYPNDGSRNQFLPVLLKTSLLQPLNEYLANGGRSMKGWYSTLDTVAADFSDCPEAFINMNDAPSLDNSNNNHKKAR
jgi:molybdopterin-guanine dinucleotide biosynthesis protein A